MKVFGPVPSRRLGRSLGVNFIPPKTCSYACVYCQLGRSMKMQVERKSFYAASDIAHEVRGKLLRLVARGERLDYLSLVPDGEPALDVHLGDLIEALKPFGIPIAVISNASLITREDVRCELMAADWVSLKVDAVWDTVWRRVNRPHRALELNTILDGMLDFAATYQGRLNTETMLVQDVNDEELHLEAMAHFLTRLSPARSYLSIPTRPPAEQWVRPPTQQAFHRGYQILQQAVGQLETLTGYEGNAFAATGDATQDLLSITAVHPMREDAVRELLTRCHADDSVLIELVHSGQLVVVAYEGNQFYQRNFRPAGQSGHASPDMDKPPTA